MKCAHSFLSRHLAPSLFKKCITAWAAAVLLLSSAGLADQTVTTPKQQFGFNLGDDYHLANYRQLVEYWQKLAQESERIRVVNIGTTEEGRTMVMGIISSPANLRQIERYREIARRLAHAEGLTDQEARGLAEEGRVIVWISGGLHASETLTAQQLMETVYQLVSGADAETGRVLDNVIVLAVPANPDGIDFIADWYMRHPEPAKREFSNYPHLYQKYIGHDNNRDFYAVTQAETKAMCRIMFREWFPQIVYDHHQSGPPGTVMFAPPFRDPFNYHLDPRVLSGVDAFGAAMMNRFLAEGKPGVTVRSGTRYSTWFNGGLRSIGYYHNVIALLTETIGNPTPMSIPFLLKLQLPRGDMLSPIQPQKWHLRQSVDYSVTANRAVLDHASRQRFELLWGIYAMGRDAIAQGSRDHWTMTPERVAKAEDALTAEAEKKKKKSGAKSNQVTSTTNTSKKASGSAASAAKDFARFFRVPADRDPRGYILPSDQPDFQTATRLVNSLIENGVRVHRATEAFAVANHPYPAGSYVILCNQAYRAHVLDMFEPQHHPNDVQYPGGPPVPPYDLAGWTPAMQMSVKFDRILEGFTGPFAAVDDVLPLPQGEVKLKPGGAAGYFFTARQNDAFRAVNGLFAAGEAVLRLHHSLEADGVAYPAGTFFVPARDGTADRLANIARKTGVVFEGASRLPGDAAISLRPVRVGLWDRYGGSMSSGWTRWVLERFEFPFEVVYAQELDAGNLRQKYDALIFVTGAIPDPKDAAAKDKDKDNEKERDNEKDKDKAPAGDSADGNTNQQNPKGPALLPEEYRSHLGQVTADKTIPQLRAFLEAGGTVLTIGSSASLAKHLGLPVEDQLTEPDKDGKAVALPREKFYIPGSLLRARVDATQPLAWGMEEQADFMFQNSPVFRFLPATTEGAADALTRVAWYEGATPLRSGWALGQTHLKDKLAIFEARVGAGHLVVCGPEIAFRAQSHGTFKFLFNGIVNAGMGK